MGAAVSKLADQMNADLEMRLAKAEAELADRRREDADPLGKLHAARVEIVEQRRRVAMAEAEVARLRAVAVAAKSFVVALDGPDDFVSLDEEQALIDLRAALAALRPTLCPDCDQPMLPAGEVKRPHEYDHARGCPRAAR